MRPRRMTLRHRYDGVGDATAPRREALRRRMDLPDGTLTFLFTDVVGSTTLWDDRPEALTVVAGRLVSPD